MSGKGKGDPMFTRLLKHADHQIEICHNSSNCEVSLECFTCSTTILYRTDNRPVQIRGQTDIYSQLADLHSPS